MTSKKKKNCRGTIKIQMKIHCLSFKSKDDTLSNIRSDRPTFVLKPLNSMMNLVVDRISFQQLDYKMERTDLLDDSIIF